MSMVCTTMSMVCTTPDISHAMGFLTRNMPKLKKEEWIIVRRVSRHPCDM
jgi:hypothetical protein